ncbi:MAG: hypothetical protein ACR2ND_12190, partial [Solirubrobacteraceae bacterium]
GHERRMRLPQRPRFTAHTQVLKPPDPGARQGYPAAVAHTLTAILFDIDGTLITSGGAGAESWRLAFDELYGIPADIGEFTDNGMTDPEVGRKTFEAVLHRAPERKEFSRLLERRLFYLHQTGQESKGYRVRPGPGSCSAN